MTTADTSRRAFFRHACCGGVALAGATAFQTSAADAVKSGLTPEQALRRMQSGNADFLAGKTRQSNLDNARRLDIAKSQAPLAVLVGCSDSRSKASFPRR